MNKRPNIILFNPDQWRGDVLGHLGYPAAVTPNLDRVVAEDGVSFSTAVCHNACCTASRCSYMTGWYPHVRGHRTMSHMLQPDEPMLLRTLKDSGYVVWWGGKNDVVPGEGGYDDYCTIKYRTPPEERAKPRAHPARADWRGQPGTDNYYSFQIGRLEGGDALAGETTSHDWAVLRGAMDFINTYRGEQPFCLFLALVYPHPPYAAEQPWFSMIDREAVPPRAPVPENRALEPALYQQMRSTLGMDGWDDARWTELRATYIAACAQVDHQFGMLMDTLKQANRYDDTAVLFFADHGDFTGDYDVVQKADNVFPDGLVRVPLIVKPPASVPVKPRVTGALAELIDVPATVEELAGIEPAHTHFGRSLLPVVAGQTDTHRDAVFAEGGRRYGERSCMGLELVDEPVEESLYWPTLRLYRTDDPSIGKAVMLRTERYKYVQRLYETDELYDLEADPQETVNRIDDPAYKDVLETLRQRMLQFHLETNDVVPHRVDAREASEDHLRRAREFNETWADQGEP